MRKLERRLWPALLAAFLAAIAFLWATPFLWTLVASFRPEGAGSAGMASLVPDTPQTLENFRNALESGSFGLYYVNTIIVVTGVLARAVRHGLASRATPSPGCAFPAAMSSSTSSCCSSCWCRRR